MTQPNPKFVTDQEGNKVEVILSITDYEALLEALEDAHDYRVLMERRANPGESISFEEMKRQLEI
jgi:hypothetical protein